MRSELDLRDADAVLNYIKEGDFDAVIQAANPNQCLRLISRTTFSGRYVNIYEFYRARNYCGRYYISVLSRG